MNRDAILDATMEAFLPRQLFSVSAYSLIRRAIIAGKRDEAAEVIFNTRQNALASEARMIFLFDVYNQLVSSLQYAIQGENPYILDEFPAQRMVQIRYDRPEPVNWQTFWPANGGRFYGGDMVALKWDQVWWRISALNLPVAPFQLGSGYDVEDVDRTEAQSLGLLTRHQRAPVLKIDLDPTDLKMRMAMAVNAASALQPPCNPPIAL